MHSIEGPCVENYRKIHFIPLSDAKCVMYPQLDYKNDGTVAVMQHIVGSDNYVFAIDGQIDECSIDGELISNPVVFNILKKIVFAIFLLSSCFLAICCAYIQLNRRYEKL